MKHKILSFFLIFALILTLLPTGTLTAHAYSSTDIPYAVEGGNIYFDKSSGSITDCDRSVTSADIPSEIDGVCVISIGDFAFSYNSNLKNVSIPKTITNIGVAAFAMCDNLNFISVDNSNEFYSSDENGVLFTKNKATLIQCPGGFSGGYAIPSTVTNIGDYAFIKCVNLTNVTLHNGVISIGNQAFSYCNKLSSIVIPDSVTAIASYAFFGCSGLRSVVIGSGVVSIGNAAFYDCANLVAVCFKGATPNSIGEDVFVYYNQTSGTVNPIPNLTIYYIQGKEGWTTPTWMGYRTATWNGDFIDVSNNAWYANSVNYVIKNSLMNGMSSITFEPETSMSRAMLVTVLWRYAGQPEAGANTFSDVENGQWYTDAVAWAAENGIVGGVGNNQFAPNGNITREQLATILFRYCSSVGIDTSARADLSAFPDSAKISPYAKDAISWAVSVGLITGTKVGNSTYLDPQGNATRAQVATILMRFIENIAK